ncbi:MAG: 50S ribosomal protein L18 [Verrucomicrobiia bacterium]
MKSSRKTRSFKRERLHARIRKKVAGVPERPRLNVAFTGTHIYAQIIDDEAGKTLVAVATTEKALKPQALKPNKSGAEAVGKLLAERAIANKIETVVFDRGGLKFHGKVKALADAAREGGLKF